MFSLFSERVFPLNSVALCLLIDENIYGNVGNKWHDNLMTTCKYVHKKCDWYL